MKPQSSLRFKQTISRDIRTYDREIKLTSGYLDSLKAGKRKYLEEQRSKLLIDLFRKYTEATKRFHFFDGKKWKAEHKFGGELEFRFLTVDEGRMGGGSRGEMGDSDPEPTYWIPNVQTYLVLRLVPETVSLARIRKIYSPIQAAGIIPRYMRAMLTQARFLSSRLLQKQCRITRTDF